MISETSTLSPTNQTQSEALAYFSNGESLLDFNACLKRCRKLNIEEKKNLHEKWSILEQRFSENSSDINQEAASFSLLLARLKPRIVKTGTPLHIGEQILDLIENTPFWVIDSDHLSNLSHDYLKELALFRKNGKDKPELVRDQIEEILAWLMKIRQELPLTIAKKQEKVKLEKVKKEILITLEGYPLQGDFKDRKNREAYCAFFKKKLLEKLPEEEKKTVSDYIGDIDFSMLVNRCLPLEQELEVFHQRGNYSFPLKAVFEVSKETKKSLRTLEAINICLDIISEGLLAMEKQPVVSLDQQMACMNQLDKAIERLEYELHSLPPEMFLF